MTKRRSNPGAIHRRIIEVMQRFPEGLSGGQIRLELEREGLLPEDQTHLDRRKRDLKKWFIIKKRTSIISLNGKKRRVTLYQYGGERPERQSEGDVGIKLRAEVIHAAHGRCQMCGRTVEKHQVTLVVDHKKPRDWGGTNDRENLWAICDECNSGKKAYFSSLDVELVRTVTAYKSVHMRIGELLKAVGIGNRTPSALIDVVADQDDWQKRLRELRYPVIGWKIASKLYKARSGRMVADYVLLSSQPWPEDPTGKIRRYEIERQKRNERIRTFEPAETDTSSIEEMPDLKGDQG